GGVTWTGTFTPTTPIEDTTNVVTLANTYTDVAGNTGTPATSANYAVDTVLDQLDAIDDTAILGINSVILHTPETYSNFQVLGIAENLGSPSVPLVVIDDGNDGVIQQSDLTTEGLINATITLPPSEKEVDYVEITYPDGTIDMINASDLNGDLINIGFEPLAEGLLNIVRAVV